VSVGRLGGQRREGESREAHAGTTERDCTPGRPSAIRQNLSHRGQDARDGES
jgi:hypothetical protein